MSPNLLHMLVFEVFGSLSKTWCLTVYQGPPFNTKEGIDRSIHRCSEICPNQPVTFIFQAACTLAELARGAGGRNHRVTMLAIAMIVFSDENIFSDQQTNNGDSDDMVQSAGAR